MNESTNNLSADHVRGLILMVIITVASTCLIMVLSYQKGYDRALQDSIIENEKASRCP